MYRTSVALSCGSLHLTDMKRRSKLTNIHPLSTPLDHSPGIVCERHFSLLFFGFLKKYSLSDACQIASVWLVLFSFLDRAVSCSLFPQEVRRYRPHGHNSVFLFFTEGLCSVNFIFLHYLPDRRV